MEYLLVGLLAAALILLIVSLFLRDPNQELREEVDQLSMQHAQDMYLIKKKLKVLEEELLVEDRTFQPAQSIKAVPPMMEKKEVHEIIKNQVIMLAKQGLSVDQIARQSSLSTEEVQAIITEVRFRGDLV